MAKEFTSDPAVILGFDTEGNPELMASILNFEVRDTEMFVPEIEVTADFPRLGDIY